MRRSNNPNRSRSRSVSFNVGSDDEGTFERNANRYIQQQRAQHQQQPRRPVIVPQQLPFFQQIQQAAPVGNLRRVPQRGRPRVNPPRARRPRGRPRQQIIEIDDSDSVSIVPSRQQNRRRGNRRDEEEKKGERPTGRQLRYQRAERRTDLNNTNHFVTELEGQQLTRRQIEAIRRRVAPRYDPHLFVANGSIMEIKVRNMPGINRKINLVNAENMAMLQEYISQTLDHLEDRDNAMYQVTLMLDLGDLNTQHRGLQYLNLSDLLERDRLSDQQRRITRNNFNAIVRGEGDFQEAVMNLLRIHLEDYENEGLLGPITNDIKLSQFSIKGVRFQKAKQVNLFRASREQRRLAAGRSNLSISSRRFIQGEQFALRPIIFTHLHSVSCIMETLATIYYIKFCTCDPINEEQFVNQQEENVMQTDWRDVQNWCRPTAKWTQLWRHKIQLFADNVLNVDCRTAIESGDIFAAVSEFTILMQEIYDDQTIQFPIIQANSGMVLQIPSQSRTVDLTSALSEMNINAAIIYQKQHVYCVDFFTLLNNKQMFAVIMKGVPIKEYGQNDRNELQDLPSEDGGDEDLKELRKQWDQIAKEYADSDNQDEQDEEKDDEFEEQFVLKSTNVKFIDSLHKSYFNGKNQFLKQSWYLLMQHSLQNAGFQDFNNDDVDGFINTCFLQQFATNDPLEFISAEAANVLHLQDFHFSVDQYPDQNVVTAVQKFIESIQNKHNKLQQHVLETYVQFQNRTEKTIAQRKSQLDQYIGFAAFDIETVVDNERIKRGLGNAKPVTLAFSGDFRSINPDDGTLVINNNYNLIPGVDISVGACKRNVIRSEKCCDKFVEFLLQSNVFQTDNKYQYAYVNDRFIRVFCRKLNRKHRKGFCTKEIRNIIVSHNGSKFDMVFMEASLRRFFNADDIKVTRHGRKIMCIECMDVYFVDSCLIMPGSLDNLGRQKLPELVMQLADDPNLVVDDQLLIRLGNQKMNLRNYRIQLNGLTNQQYEQFNETQKNIFDVYCLQDALTCNLLYKQWAYRNFTQIINGMFPSHNYPFKNAPLPLTQAKFAMDTFQNSFLKYDLLASPSQILLYEKQSYKGGITSNFQLKGKLQDNPEQSSAIVSIDFKSSYPSILVQKLPLRPLSTEVLSFRQGQKIKKHHLYLIKSIKFPPACNFPTLMTKVYNALISDGPIDQDKLRTQIRKNDNFRMIHLKEIDHTDQDDVYEILWGSEILDPISMGAQIDIVGYIPYHAEYITKDYIDFFFESRALSTTFKNFILRQQYAQLVANEAKIIKFFPQYYEQLMNADTLNEFDKNAIISMFNDYDGIAKLALNALYGKFAQNLCKDEFVMNMNEATEFLMKQVQLGKNISDVIISSFPTESGILQTFSLESSQQLQQTIGGMMRLASYTTACARTKLMRAAAIIEEQLGQGSVLYADTDSIYFEVALANDIRLSMAGYSEQQLIDMVLQYYSTGQSDDNPNKQILARISDQMHQHIDNDPNFNRLFNIGVPDLFEKNKVNNLIYREPILGQFVCERFSICGYFGGAKLYSTLDITGKADKPFYFNSKGKGLTLLKGKCEQQNRDVGTQLYDFELFQVLRGQIQFLGEHGKIPAAKLTQQLKFQAHGNSININQIYKMVQLTPYKRRILFEDQNVYCSSWTDLEQYRTEIAPFERDIILMREQCKSEYAELYARQYQVTTVNNIFAITDPVTCKVSEIDLQQIENDEQIFIQRHFRQLNPTEKYMLSVNKLLHFAFNKEQVALRSTIQKIYGQHMTIFNTYFSQPQFHQQFQNMHGPVAHNIVECSYYATVFMLMQYLLFDVLPYMEYEDEQYIRILQILHNCDKLSNEIVFKNKILLQQVISFNEQNQFKVNIDLEAIEMIKELCQVHTPYTPSFAHLLFKHFRIQFQNVEQLEQKWEHVQEKKTAKYKANNVVQQFTDDHIQHLADRYYDSLPENKQHRSNMVLLEFFSNLIQVNAQNIPLDWTRQIKRDVNTGQIQYWSKQNQFVKLVLVGFKNRAISLQCRPFVQPRQFVRLAQEEIEEVVEFIPPHQEENNEAIQMGTVQRFINFLEIDQLLARTKESYDCNQHVQSVLDQQSTLITGEALMPQPIALNDNESFFSDSEPNNDGDEEMPDLMDIVRQMRQQDQEDLENQIMHNPLLNQQEDVQSVNEEEQDQQAAQYDRRMDRQQRIMGQFLEYEADESMSDQ